VAGSNTCQTTCDVSRDIDDRDRSSKGQVSKIKAPSANRRSGYRRSQAQRFCAFRNRDPRNPDEWGTTVIIAAKEDRGLVDASCQR
jgi:hypothetical protein